MDCVLLKSMPVFWTSVGRCCVTNSWLSVCCCYLAMGKSPRQQIKKKKKPTHAVTDVTSLCLQPKVIIRI